MKQSALILCVILILSTLFFGCNQQAQDADPKTLPFPGTAWGMTPAELCTALELTENDYVESLPEASGDSYLVTGVHLEVFGADAQIEFRFDDVNSDGEYCLYQVRLGYPQDADMQTVNAAITALYGEPVEQDDSNASWESDILIQDLMSEEDKALVASHGDMAERMAQKPVTRISWAVDSRFPAAYNDTTVYDTVTFYSEAAMYTKEGGYAALYGSNAA